MRAVYVLHFNGRQPSDLTFRLRDEFPSEGWGVMCGIEIPQQDFALKMQGGGGGLMHEEGLICGTLWYLSSQCN